MDSEPGKVGGPSDCVGNLTWSGAEGRNGVGSGKSV